MTEVKVKLQNDFTLVPNSFLDDSSISLEAKGLYAYCLRVHQSSNIGIDKIALHSSDNEDQIQSAINELKKAGCLV